MGYSTGCAGAGLREAGTQEALLRALLHARVGLGQLRVRLALGIPLVPKSTGVAGGAASWALVVIPSTLCPGTGASRSCCGCGCRRRGRSGSGRTVKSQAREALKWLRGLNTLRTDPHLTSLSRELHTFALCRELTNVSALPQVGGCLHNVVAGRVVAEAGPSAGVAAASDRNPAGTECCRCGRCLNSEAQAGEASERDGGLDPLRPSPHLTPPLRELNPMATGSYHAFGLTGVDISEADDGVVAARVVAWSTPSACTALPTIHRNPRLDDGCGRGGSGHSRHGIHGLGGANFSEGHVGKGHGAVGMRVAHTPGQAIWLAWTKPTLHSRICAWLVSGEARVQPHHADVHIIPKRESCDVTAIKRFAHAPVATLLLEIVDVPEERLLVLTHLVGDGIWVSWQNRDGRTLEDFPILDIEASDFRQVTLVGAVRGEELGHHRHWL